MELTDFPTSSSVPRFVVRPRKDPKVEYVAKASHGAPAFHGFPIKNGDLLQDLLKFEGPDDGWHFFPVAIASISPSVSFKYNGNITYINVLIQSLGIYIYILCVINIKYIYIRVYIYPFNHWTSLVIYECFHRCHRVADIALTRKFA